MTKSNYTLSIVRGFETFAWLVTFDNKYCKTPKISPSSTQYPTSISPQS